jgi:hypothetical protein
MTCNLCARKGTVAPNQALRFAGSGIKSCKFLPNPEFYGLVTHCLHANISDVTRRIALLICDVQYYVSARSANHR